MMDAQKPISIMLKFKHWHNLFVLFHYQYYLITSNKNNFNIILIDLLSELVVPKFTKWFLVLKNFKSTCNWRR